MNYVHDIIVTEKTETNVANILTHEFATGLEKKRIPIVFLLKRITMIIKFQKLFLIC